MSDPIEPMSAEDAAAFDLDRSYQQWRTHNWEGVRTIISYAKRLEIEQNEAHMQVDQLKGDLEATQLERDELREALWKLLSTKCSACDYWGNSPSEINHCSTCSHEITNGLMALLTPAPTKEEDDGEADHD